MTRRPLVLLALVLAGCSAPVHGAPGTADGEVAAVLLELDADGSAPGGHAALSPAPIHLGAFASWFGQGRPTGAAVAGTTPPGSTYLAVTGATGCRVPTGVRVVRTGADLRVDFTGGEDRPECVRPVGPVAHLALPAGAVAGVRTVDGTAPLAPTGPGEQLDHLELGAARLEPFAPVELGTPSAGAMARALAAAGVAGQERIASALAWTPTEGRRGFAFVFAGCAETGAVLLIDRDVVTAALVGGENTDCDAPVHLLVTFAVDAEFVPATATLDG